jgi:hypothetical protein
MFLKKVDHPRTVKLSNGRILSISDLPPAHTHRWVASRKEVVVRAVANNLISRNEALKKYMLTDEELTGWESALAVSGNSGLKVTRLQSSRQS